MEYVSEEPLDDSDSVLEGCSLGASEMLDQIVVGRATRNADLSFDHYISTESVESNNETPSMTPCSIKKRLQSTDSGMESGGRGTRNANLSFSHYIPNESVESNDERLSMTLCQKCSIKKRLQSADSGTESEGNSPCIGLTNNLFQKYCQTPTDGIRDESILTDHDHFNKSENKTLDCDGLQTISYCGNNHIGLPRLTVNNQVICHQDINSAAERVDGYIGLEMVNESLCALCAEKFGNQLQVKVNQDHHLSKSAHDIVVYQEDQDQCSLKLTEKFDYVGSEVVNQNQCLPKLTENLDYVGLDVVDQDQCLPKCTEKFDHDGLQIINQNQCLPKSTEIFDYVGLEVVDQDHFLPRPVEEVDGNHILKSMEKYDYVGLELVDQNNIEIKGFQIQCMPKSTDKFGDYIEAEADQGHSMSRSPEKFGNYVGLEVACQDQCACKSTETFVDCVTVEIVNQDHSIPSLTEKVEDTGDQYCCVHRSTEKVDGDNYSQYSGGSEAVSQSCKTICYQGIHEGSLSSINSHDDEAIHEREHYLQDNDDVAMATSPVLTGLYCS